MCTREPKGNSIVRLIGLSAEKAQRHEERHDSGGERQQRGEQARRGHPAAWSSTVTLNGRAARGSTSNVRPQRPTMTSAGVSRP